jgi:hypothetical protein
VNDEKLMNAEQLLDLRYKKGPKYASGNLRTQRPAFCVTIIHIPSKIRKSTPSSGIQHALPLFFTLAFHAIQGSYYTLCCNNINLLGLGENKCVFFILCRLKHAYAIPILNACLFAVIIVIA